MMILEEGDATTRIGTNTFSLRLYFYSLYDFYRITLGCLRISRLQVLNTHEEALLLEHSPGAKPLVCVGLKTRAEALFSLINLLFCAVLCAVAV